MSAEAFRSTGLLLPPEFLSRPLKSAVAIDPTNPLEIDDALHTEKMNQSGDYRVEVHISDAGLLYGIHDLIEGARELGWSQYFGDNRAKTVPMLPSSVLDLLSLETGGPDGTPSLEVGFEFNAHTRSIGNVSLQKARVVVEALSYKQHDRRVNEGFRGSEARQLQEVASRINTIPSKVRRFNKDYLSEDIVGQLMVATNKIVAVAMEERGIPWLFRNHGQGTFDRWRDEREQIILKRLKVARYGRVATRHEGVRTSKYCHFTSPLRRFPDLANHLNLHADMTGQPMPFDENEIDEIAEEMTAKHIERTLQDRMNI
jgi:exoribonuclease R